MEGNTNLVGEQISDIQGTMGGKADISIRSVAANSTETISIPERGTTRPILIVIGRSTDSTYSAVYAHFSQWTNQITPIIGNTSKYNVTMSAGGGSLYIQNTTSSNVDAMILL